MLMLMLIFFFGYAATEIPRYCTWIAVVNASATKVWTPTARDNGYVVLPYLNIDAMVSQFVNVVAFTRVAVPHVTFITKT